MTDFEDFPIEPNDEGTLEATDSDTEFDTHIRQTESTGGQYRPDEIQQVFSGVRIYDYPTRPITNPEIEAQISNQESTPNNDNEEQTKASDDAQSEKMKRLVKEPKRDILVVHSPEREEILEKVRKIRGKIATPAPEPTEKPTKNEESIRRLSEAASINIPNLDERLLLELNSFELLRFSRHWKKDIIEIIKMFGSKGYHGSSIGHPMRGIMDTDIAQLIYMDLPVAVIGPRPFTFTRKHDFANKLHDAYEYAIDTTRSKATNLFHKYVLGKAPIDVPFDRTEVSYRRLLRNIVNETGLYPGRRLSEAMMFWYERTYPNAVREFETFEDAFRYREVYDDGRPIAIKFSSLLEMSPELAAVVAKDNYFTLSLNLDEARKGIPAKNSRSLPGRPTRSDSWTWRETLATLKDTSIIRVAGDPGKITRHSRKRELTLTAQGAETEINEMLEYIREVVEVGLYKGYLVTDIEALNRQFILGDVRSDMNLAYMLGKHLEQVFYKAKRPNQFKRKK